jgi:hypothetical protein
MPEPITELDSALFALKDERAVLHVYQPTRLAEPPEWSPFLPVPGTYQHPVYGELDFSPDAYSRIIDNFKSGIYDQRLPVNVEHDPQSAGAVGWVVDLRLADSGAIEAQVEWTKRGRELIEDDRFKYVSAEIYPSWPDPVNPDTIFQDVAVGLALTTHPYFKERVLPPLVASEAVLTLAEAGKESDMPDPKDQDEQVEAPAEQAVETPPVQDVEKIEAPVDKDATTDTETVAQLSDRIIADMKAKLGENPNISDPAVRRLAEDAARELAEARIKVKTAEAATAKMLAENATLRQENRLKTFSDEVLGKSKANGTPWQGAVEENVKFSMNVAEKFGEESWEMRHWVQTMRALSEQIKAGSLFTEIGTGRSTEENQGTYEKISGLAAERAKASGRTFAQEFDAILSTDAELRAAYAREMRG